MGVSYSGAVAQCVGSTSVFHVLAGLPVAGEQLWGYLTLPATRGQQKTQDGGLPCYGGGGVPCEGLNKLLPTVFCGTFCGLLHMEKSALSQLKLKHNR